MRLRPCHTCRFAGDCELQNQIKEQMRVAAAGFPKAMRPTLVSFRCTKRIEGLVEGAVCKTTVIDRGHDYYGEIERPRSATVTIMRRFSRYHKELLCYLHPHEANEREVIWRRPNQVQPTGETVELCADCDRPIDSPLAEEREAGECCQIGKHRTKLEARLAEELPREDRILF